MQQQTLPYLDMPYLDMSKQGFSIRSAEVLDAREKSWIARTNYGLAVLRYNEVHKLLRDQRLRQGSYAWPELNGVSGLFAGWWHRQMMSQEGADHARLRRIANPVFSPKLVISLRPKFFALAHELIDQFIEKGHCEFMGDFSEPYATRVVCLLIGLPQDQWRAISTIAKEMGLALSVNYKRDLEIIDNATAKLFDYVQDLVRQTRARGYGDDFLSTLVRTSSEGDDTLSERELYDMLVSVLFGAVDTTSNQIGLALSIFAEHPDQWELLGKNPELGKAAVEEVMRVRPAITWVTREALEDFEYQGVYIKKGTTIHLFGQSAASDPRAFPDPSFDITAERKPHFGFGGGVHHCVGHFIARADMNEALAILASRLKNIRIESGAQWLPDSGNTGPITLPISFDRGPLSRDLGIDIHAVAEESADAEVVEENVGGTDLTILFGTQTGNAEQMASDVASIARKRGFNPVVLPLNAISLELLGNLRRVLIVTSSYGDGEMPDSAQQFWESLDSDDPTRIENLTYSVMAMGDSGYERFCNAGRLIDERLASRGALRVADRANCDVNYATTGFAWVDEALAAMQSVEGVDNITRDALLLQSARLARPKWTRHKPFLSEATENRSLSTADAEKEVRHVVFNIAGSGIVYEPGDCIGLLPTNDPDLVEAFFNRFGTCSHAPVTGFDDNLGTLLSEKLEIRIPSHALILKVEELAKDPELTHIVEGGDRDSLDAWLWGRDILDLLDMVPSGKLPIEMLLPLLNPLQHRTYSIASSTKLHPDEIHLTIAKVHSSSRGRDRLGVCSGYLAERLPTGVKAPIFMSPNRAFRLPADDNAPIIMIGPGTGIAPFRAFLQERKARGAKGKNWLFFGNRHRNRDFLYGEEFVEMQKSGLLTHLDLAFSRDQAAKIYVQHRMRENAKELFSWLESGAYLYVCGDGKRMAYDVEEALLWIIEKQAGLGPEEAQAYVDRLRREKRYLRDVY